MQRAALPAVVGKGQPLQFREWRPEVPMSEGALGIPVPEGTAVVVPDAVLVPPVGFSDDGWRLGYGVFPAWLVDPIEKLMVNSNSCTASFTQRAAPMRLEMAAMLSAAKGSPAALRMG